MVGSYVTPDKVFKKKKKASIFATIDFGIVGLIKSNAHVCKAAADEPDS